MARYGKPQLVEGNDARNALAVITKTVGHMKAVGVDLSEDIVDECTNKEECEWKCVAAL